MQIDPTIRPLSLPLASAKAWPLFWAHLRSRWLIYVVGFIAVIITNLTEALIPKCIQWTIDLLGKHPIPKIFLRNEVQDTFTLILLLLVVLWVIQGLSRRYWRFTLGRETHYAEASLRSSLWQRVRYFPTARLQSDLGIGVLMNVAAGDTRVARASFGWVLVGLIDVIFLTTFTVLSMATISLRLTLLSLLLCPVLVYLLRTLQRREYLFHEQAQEALSAFNDLCSQAVASIKLQRLTGTGPVWVKRLTTAADDYRKQRFNVVMTALRFFVTMGCAPLFSYAVLFVFGLRAVLSGEITVGAFVTLQTYVLILQSPLSEMGFVLGDWQRGMASLGRICDVYRTPLGEGLVSDGSLSEVITPVNGVPLLEAHAINLTYGDRTILHDVSFALQRGERLGITGPIGAGKSSLIGIVSGLEHGYSGQVLLYGRDMKLYSHPALRSFIGMVPQKPFLFADTVRANISLKHTLSDDEIWHYLEVTALAEEVRRLPGQLDAMLGEWGINLSGGQKQRLTLTRALASKPTILLLDDCLSAVDTVTEEHILRSLDAELRTTTLVWAAHRTSTLRYCNKLIELHA